MGYLSPLTGLRAAATVLAIALLSGCLEPEASATAPEDAQTVVDSLTYTKNKQGICFAVGTTLRSSSNGVLTKSTVLTWVPCKEAGL